MSNVGKKGLALSWGEGAERCLQNWVLMDSEARTFQAGENKPNQESWKRVGGLAEIQCVVASGLLVKRGKSFGHRGRLGVRLRRARGAPLRQR